MHASCIFKHAASIVLKSITRYHRGHTVCVYSYIHCTHSCFAGNKLLCPRRCGESTPWIPQHMCTFSGLALDDIRTFLSFISCHRCLNCRQQAASVLDCATNPGSAFNLPLDFPVTTRFVSGMLEVLTHQQEKMALSAATDSNARLAASAVQQIAGTGPAE